MKNILLIVILFVIAKNLDAQLKCDNIKYTYFINKYSLENLD